MTCHGVPLYVAVFGLALLPSAVVAQATQSPSQRDADFIFVSTAQPEDRAAAEAVMKVDEAFRLAKLRGDPSASQGILHDDYIGVNQTGNTRDKKQILELFEWFRIESLVTNRAHVRFSGDNAVVTGEQSENSATGNDQDAVPANSGTPSTAPQLPLAPMLPAKNLRDPFARLFMNPAPPLGAATGRNVRLADPQPIHQRRVGPCGMVMFESLHDVDPRIGRQVPPGEFAIRAVVPKTCSEK